MGQNDNKDGCKSDRCCCQLISKCEEKPAAATPRPRNTCGAGRKERTEMSICDFLKSQPTPEWILKNNGRGNRPEVNDSKDRQCGPIKQQPPPASNCSGKNHTTYVHRPKPQPQWVRSSEQISVPNDGGMRQSQHRRRNDQRPQTTACEPEDRQLSQIIINFGTVVTGGETCKPNDSGQQNNNSEVHDVPLEKKRRTGKATARPPTDRSTCCARAPAADRSISICPPAERSNSTGPPEHSSCTRGPAERSTTTSPPDHSSCTRGTADRSTSTCPPPERQSCARDPVDRPTLSCQQDRSSSTRAPTDRPISTCPLPDRSSCTRGATDHSACSSRRAPANRSNSSYTPADHSTYTRGQANFSTSITSPPDLSSSTGQRADFLTFSSARAPANRSTPSCPLADHSSFTLPQASSTFIRPSTDRPNFTCSKAERNNRSVSTRSPTDWSTYTRSPADRSSSVRPPNVRPPNVRPFGMESNMMARGAHSLFQDNAVPSTQQGAHSQSTVKSKTTSCNCDNSNSELGSGCNNNMSADGMKIFK